MLHLNLQTTPNQSEGHPGCRKPCSLPPINPNIIMSALFHLWCLSSIYRHTGSREIPPSFSLDLPCQVCSMLAYLIHSHFGSPLSVRLPLVTLPGCPYRRTKVSKGSSLLSPSQQAAPATTMTPNPMVWDIITHPP